MRWRECARHLSVPQFQHAGRDARSARCSMPESAVPCRAGARAARDFAKSPVVVRGARQTHAWAATAPSQGARARTGLIAVRWCVPAPSGSVMAKRAPFPCAALGLVLLAASVEGILDAAPHSALRPGLRRREPVAMGLASVPSPPVPREPLGFIAGFDFDAFGKGLKDFALGGISGGRASCVPVAVGRRGCCSAASRARRSTGPA